MSGGGFVFDGRRWLCSAGSGRVRPRKGDWLRRGAPFAPEVPVPFSLAHGSVRPPLLSLREILSLGGSVGRYTTRR